VRLAAGHTRPLYPRPTVMISSVLANRREETIIFEPSDTSPRGPGKRGTYPPLISVPTEFSYDTPIRDNWQNDCPTDTIPTVITFPQVPEEILVTLSPTMVNAMYKNLCAIYSSRHSGTIPELLRPNADKVYAILQNFGCTVYDCAGWQHDPSLDPLLFDTTFLQTLLHRVTRVRSRKYVRELEASSANATDTAGRQTLTPASTHAPL
jgi:hypothetical protein